MNISNDAFQSSMGTAILQAKGLAVKDLFVLAADDRTEADECFAKNSAEGVSSVVTRVAVDTDGEPRWSMLRKLFVGDGYDIFDGDLQSLDKLGLVEDCDLGDVICGVVFRQNTMLTSRVRHPLLKIAVHVEVGNLRLHEFAMPFRSPADDAHWNRHRHDDR